MFRPAIERAFEAFDLCGSLFPDDQHLIEISLLFVGELREGSLRHLCEALANRFFGFHDRDLLSRLPGCLGSPAALSSIVLLGAAKPRLLAENAR